MSIYLQNNSESWDDHKIVTLYSKIIRNFILKGPLRNLTAVEYKELWLIIVIGLRREKLSKYGALRLIDLLSQIKIGTYQSSVFQQYPFAAVIGTIFYCCEEYANFDNDNVNGVRAFSTSRGVREAMGDPQCGRV